MHNDNQYVDIIKLQERVKGLESAMQMMIQSVCAAMNPSYSQEQRATAVRELYLLQDKILYASKDEDTNEVSLSSFIK